MMPSLMSYVSGSLGITLHKNFALIRIGNQQTQIHPNGWLEFNGTFSTKTLITFSKAKF